MKHGLFLDDVRTPEDVKWVSYEFPTNWTIVRDYSEFIDAIGQSCLQFEIISFDHDLGPSGIPGTRSRTGYDCVCYLVDRWMKEGCSTENLPIVYVHSQNPIGAENIAGYWNSFVRSLKL